MPYQYVLQCTMSYNICAIILSLVPGKITEVNISKTEVMNNKMKQYFTWISPNSRANYSYVIKYGFAANVTSPNGTSIMTKRV